LGIKAITFDFWSTLFKDTGDIGKNRHVWRIENMAKGLAKAGWMGSPAEILAAIEIASNRGTEIRLKGEVDFLPEEQIELIFKQLAVSPSKEVFEEVLRAYTKASGEFPPAPMPGTIETVKELSKKYPIGLISNTGITPGSVLRTVLEGAGIIDCFKVLTFSNEVNLVKPNPEIFKLTAKGLGVDVRDTVHIGDDFEADVVGAQGVGASGIWLNPKEDSKQGKAFAVIKELTELQEILGRNG
jgi:HAD superfamily hydrolase (TIGR01509 family)